MSTLKTNNIEHLDASTPSVQTTIGGGTIITGVSTFQGDANFDGNVNIAGSMTYEDVTSVDSVGIITAQAGIRVTGGDVGIGTDNPINDLHINNDATGVGPIIQLTNDTGDCRLFFGQNSTAGSANAQGQFRYNVASNYMAMYTAGSERMRIDSSGYLHIGNSVNAQNTDRLIQMGDTSRSASYLEIRTATNGAAGVLFSDDVAATDSGYRGTMEYSHSNDTMSWRTAGTTHLRLDANGQVGILANTNPITARSTASASTSTEYLTGLYGATQITTGGTVAIKIYTNGNIQNTNNSYGSLSDSKLKENIVDASSQWDDIKGIRVRNYNLIEGQTHTQLGVIAQEVEAVSPGLVFDTPDKDNDGNDLGTVTKGVNYSVLYMKAVKALQEAMTRIETLEAKVTTLEGS